MFLFYTDDEEEENEQKRRAPALKKGGKKTKRKKWVRNFFWSYADWQPMVRKWRSRKAGSSISRVFIEDGRVNEVEVDL